MTTDREPEFLNVDIRELARLYEQLLAERNLLLRKLEEANRAISEDLAHLKATITRLARIARQEAESDDYLDIPLDPEPGAWWTITTRHDDGTEHTESVLTADASTATLLTPHATSPTLLELTVRRDP
jgi:hypothetical protein